LGALVDGAVFDLAGEAEALGVPRIPSDMIAFIEAGDEALLAARAAVEAARAVGRRGAPIESVRLLAPIPRPRKNVMCVGLNYAEHARESQSVSGPDVPEVPVFFTKAPTCVVGPDEPIPYPEGVSQAVDWEAELVVVIGRRVRDVPASEALACVFGYTAGNDVTARDLQRAHQQWFKGKSLDGFCPLGPWIVTADEIPDPQALRIRLRVDGVTKQDGSTADMITPVAGLIASLSSGMTLEPGDVLMTGTPAGVGAGRTPPEFLRPGNVVEVEIERIGTLRNPVVAPERLPLSASSGA
jgi:2-keto-4-pentenoate hydratase/2-oxohepta-3-ene-1,7-dioic acid hydratase in catechol pathway